MIDIKNCPSSLQEGFDTYSPKASKLLFGANRISPMLNFNIDEFRNVGEIVEAMHRISVSGVQEKFPAIIENGKIRIAQDGERSTHILKPAPWDKTLRERKQIPANEHLTMQIASQVYGIMTASNGLCFTPDGQAVYIGLVSKRANKILDRSMTLPDDARQLIDRSYLSEKMKRNYIRIVNERISRFTRISE